MDETLRITAAEMKEVFEAVLLKEGFTGEKAAQLAEVFTANSVDGVYTHGVNRFPTFVQFVREGFVQRDKEPSLHGSFGAIEQWNGNLGPGVLNALAATDRAAQLAAENGIGCVALANTNHWMRGGYYGWQAAKKGCVFIGWTNTVALMPAWGAVDAKLGNNPLVLALPFGGDAIVLDMAMSQFSYGAMQLAAAKGEKLPVAGGFDAEGKLTDNPSAVLKSRRALPIGYWKGAGLALLLDVLAAVLSGGLATNQVTKLEKEHALSQVFICIDQKKLTNASIIGEIIASILDEYKQSVPENDNSILYPGERVLQTRAQNLANGIPVLPSIWDDIQKLISS